MGMELPLPVDTTFVASLRFTTALHLRIDEITGSEEDAAQSAQTLNGLLVMARAVMHSEVRTPGDEALRQFEDSIAIEQKTDRVALTATVPGDALKSLGGEK